MLLGNVSLKVMAITVLWFCHVTSQVEYRTPRGVVVVEVLDSASTACLGKLDEEPQKKGSDVMTGVLSCHGAALRLEICRI